MSKVLTPSLLDAAWEAVEHGEPELREPLARGVVYDAVWRYGDVAACRRQ
jgi:hypothetical protein